MRARDKTRRNRYDDKKQSAKAYPISLCCINFMHDGNLGFLIRSAACFGAETVHVIGSVPARSTLNAPSGSLYDYVKIKKHATPSEFLDFVKINKIRLVSAEICEDSKPIASYSFDFIDDLVLVVGNEQSGIPTEILKNIKTFLGEEIQEEVKVELAQAKLENGTIVESESFKAGDEIFIITDDEKVAMPVGEYVMEDGKLLVVEEEGIIADYRVVSDDVPQKEDELAEEESVDDGKEAAVDDWAGMEKRIKNLEDAIADLKSKMGEKEDFEKVEEQVKQELSETPAAEPISHNPEVEDKKINLKYAQNRKQTSLDRVLSKMYNK